MLPAFWIENHFWSDRYNFLLRQKIPKKKTTFSLCSHRHQNSCVVFSVWMFIIFRAFFIVQLWARLAIAFARSECRNDVTQYIIYGHVWRSWLSSTPCIAVSHFLRFVSYSVLLCMRDPQSSVLVYLFNALLCRCSPLERNFFQHLDEMPTSSRAHFHLLHIERAHRWCAIQLNN